MKTPLVPRIVRPVGAGFCLALAVAATLLVGQSARAASQTWSGGSGANGNWGTGTNWLGGAAPGSTSLTNSSDLATFDGPITNSWGNSGSPVVIDSATQNIKGINFDANAASFFIGSTGGNSLRLTTNGGVQLLSTLLGSGKTFSLNAPLIIGSGTAAVSTSFTNNATVPTNILAIGGQISGGSTNATGSTTLFLTGTNTGNNTVSGNIVNGASATGVVVNKTGAGTWVLSGTNAYTGTTTLTAGKLVLDMNAGGSLSASSLLTGNGGTFEIKGLNNGASTQTMANFTSLGTAMTTIKLSPTGSGSVNFVLGNTWTHNQTSGGGALNIDLSAGNATLTSSPTLTNSIIDGGHSDAYVTVTDATATGFGTVIGGNVVRYTGATTLAAGLLSSSTNYITSGFTVSAASNVVNTLQLDQTAAGAGSGTGILDLNTKTLALTSKALLATGSGNFTIQNGQVGTNAEVFIHQFATGTLTISARMGNATANATMISKDGPGTLVLTGTNVNTGATTVSGGVLRAVDGTGLSAGSLLTINGGVFETSAATFTRTLGSAAGNVQVINGAGGFSANGGAVDISIGGTGTETALQWGNASFSPDALVLNESTANNTLNFKNAIDLNGAVRTVNVNASGANAATISGVLSSSVAGGGLMKGGVGTLVLSGPNTYSGTTMVSAGTLLVSGSLANTSAVTVSGGTLKLGANNSLNSVAAMTLSGGTFDAQTFTNSLGVLTLSGNSFFNLGSGAAIAFADSSAATWGAFSINLTGFVSGSSLRFGTTNAGLTGGQLADFTAPGVTAFGLNSNGYLISVVPEASTWALLAFSMTTIMVLRRRRS